MTFKRNQSDETVLREMSSAGLRIGWKDSTSGEVYTFLLGERAAIDTALREDGLNPADFWPEVGV